MAMLAVCNSSWLLLAIIRTPSMKVYSSVACNGYVWWVQMSRCQAQAHE